MLPNIRSEEDYEMLLKSWKVSLNYYYAEYCRHRDNPISKQYFFDVYLGKLGECKRRTRLI